MIVLKINNWSHSPKKEVQLQLNTYFGQLIKYFLMMKPGYSSHEVQRLQSHPLFLDSEFIPQDLKYVLAHPYEADFKNLPNSIVVPYEKDDVTFIELESKIKSKLPAQFGNSLSKINLPESPKKPMIKECDQKGLSMIEYKKQYGKKNQTIEVLELVSEKQLSNIRVPPLMKNYEKYEICLISLHKNQDVFMIKIQWTPELNVCKLLTQFINSNYDCKLTQKHIEFYALKIEVFPDKQYCSLNFNNKKLISGEEQFHELIFGHSKAVYIGFLSLSSSFDSERRKQITQSQAAIKPEVYQTGQYYVEDHKQKNKNRILVLQLEDKIGFRLQYHVVRDYTIKFLLGIMNVTNHHKKGLMVLGKIYKPDDYIRIFDQAFSMSGLSDLNFIQAKVVAERQLFFAQVQDQKQILNYKEMTDFVEYNGNYQQKLPCLAAYINQGLFPKDHNEIQQPISIPITNYINNYFIQYHPYETGTWKRYVKTILAEIQTLPVHRGWAYRIVNYVYDKKVKDTVSFKNFIIGTKREDKIRLKLKLNYKEKNTVFKIRSTSGRAIEKISTLMLDEVIFLPYTSFQILSRVDHPTYIEYELQQELNQRIQNRYNLLMWVDDKPQEGKNFFRTLKSTNIGYPIYLFQVSSTKEFEAIIKSNSKYFHSSSAKKIIISNMKRYQDNHVNDKAGVDTFKLAKASFKENWHFVFYIGHIQGTQKKLAENGVKEGQCVITNDPSDLYTQLEEMCNWETYSQEGPGHAYSSIFEPPEQNWGDVFSTFKSVKSSSVN